MFTGNNRVCGGWKSKITDSQKTKSKTRLDRPGCWLAVLCSKGSNVFELVELCNQHF